MHKSNGNRKHVTDKDTYTYKGQTYALIEGKSGYYTPILRSMINQLNKAEKIWKRVLVVRFDLHQADYTDDNSHVRSFLKDVKAKICKKYGKQSIGHAWAREQEKAKAQHYHGALFLDGGKFRTSYAILKIIKATWESRADRNHVPRLDDPYYFVDSEKVKHEAVYRLSYLAKERGKGYRPPQTKDYSTSRLKVENKPKAKDSVVAPVETPESGDNPFRSPYEIAKYG